MSLPRLLLVDDSEAILAYERAALSAHYDLSTALNGQEALEKVRTQKPDGVVLDLSMPVMTGDAVLAALQADPELKGIPVVIVSSERQRAEAFLKGGAVAYLPKPIRAEELRAVLAKALEDARQKSLQGGLAAIILGVGEAEVAFPLDCVEAVVLLPKTRSVAAGPSYLNEVIDFHGSPVAVLDLARPLRAVHAVRRVDRKLVVVRMEADSRLAFEVDHVRDPEEFAPAAVTRRGKLAGKPGDLVGRALIAVVQSARGPIAVLDPRELLSRSLLRRLGKWLLAVEAEAREQTQ